MMLSINCENADCEGCDDGVANNDEFSWRWYEVDDAYYKGEEFKAESDNNKDGGVANKESSVVSNPDEAQMNNIDLGGVLNLAAEDTLNIRLENLSERVSLYFHSAKLDWLSWEIFFSESSCGTFTTCGVSHSRSSPSLLLSIQSWDSQQLWWAIIANKTIKII